MTQQAILPAAVFGALRQYLIKLKALKKRLQVILTGRLKIQLTKKYVPVKRVMRKR